MSSAAAMPDPWSWGPGPGRHRDRSVSLIPLRGSDTRRFLHGQTSADLLQAPPGRWVPTCCITPTARLLGIAAVFLRPDPSGDEAVLMVEEGDAAAIHAALDRVLFPADRVRLGPVQPARCLQALEPDGTPGVLAVLAADGRTWPDPVPAVLRQGSALAAEEAERWRIQWGDPAAPGEIREAFNPFELGLADRVSLSKGCYVGQETLAKLATYDGVRQQLRRWFCGLPAGRRAEELVAGPLAPGRVLRDAEGERAAEITSLLALPENSGAPAGVIGLAMVRRRALTRPALMPEPVQEGETGELTLAMSVPSGFVAPPGS